MREAQRRIDSREFGEWQAFYRLEPWGAEADDRRAAQVAATVANGLLPRKDKRPWTETDFMPRYWTPKARPPAEPRRSLRAWRATLEALNAAFGGRDMRSR